MSEAFPGMSIPFSSSNFSNSKTEKPSDDSDSIKMKIAEQWHKFKFDASDGKDVKPGSPLWILGKCYFPEQTEENFLVRSVKNYVGEIPNASSDYPHIRKFFHDFNSRLWFTYRKGFPPLEGTTLTTDTSWGCMLRTGQMMVGQCLLIHFLGRDWRWRLMKPEDLKEMKLHRDIINLFIDEPNRRCPFGLHNLTTLGLNYQVKPGKWYGPGTVAYILQDAMECGKGANPMLNDLALYVAQDCTVYEDDVKRDCRWGKFSKPDEDLGRSVIILIPVRLGESTMNQSYLECVRQLLELESSVGIIGGKPKHSLYFIGYQDESLIYLDPHYCQSADSLTSFKNEHCKTYHCTTARNTLFSKLDPSCCLGFYCPNEEAFGEFTQQMRRVLHSPYQKTHYPLCVIHDGSIDEQKLKFKEMEKNEHRTNKPDLEVLGKDTQSYTSESFESITCDEIVQPVVEGETGNSLSDPTSEASSSKKDILSKSLPNPKKFFKNFYRQHSKSPKSHRKELNIEEEFEFL